MCFLSELKRRNVIRMAGLYLVGAWLIVQIAETLLPIFKTPDWVLQTLVLLLALGFIPALVFSWVFELTPDGLRRDSGAVHERSARKLDMAVIVLLLAVVAMTAWHRFAPVPAAPASVSTTEPAAAAIANDATPAVPDPSIAVLAFADMSAGGDNEYLGDGIAEEILNALAKVDGLKVAGRTSSFRYKGADQDLREIGQALGVAHVLEGSVRLQDKQVRITAQLIRTADGFHLWSETYPGTLDDVFTLQESIARAVTDELKVRLGGEQQARLVNVGTENGEAYSLYLQASLIFHRRQGPRMAEAEAMLHKAVALDPGFARAWARMASLRAVARNYNTVDQSESREGVEEAARKAIAIDPTLAEPHAAMALGFGQVRRYAEERAEFARALALDPDDIMANLWYGTTLESTGYSREAEERLDHALALDPLLPVALLWRGLAHIQQGELDTGERQLRLAEESGLAFAGLGLGRLAVLRGDVEAAAGHFDTAFHALAADVPRETIAIFARACAGDPAARGPALVLADELLAQETTAVPAVAVYMLLTLGETDRAFDLVAPASTSNDALIFGSLFRDNWPEVRLSPRFPEFARQAGLAELWDQEGAPDGCRKVANDWICAR
jgi:TolB-like protein/Tfp pilus assembly protein PilF